MTFHVGQMVVCVDDRQDGRIGNEPWPVLKNVYTISDFRVLDDGLGVRVSELPTPLEDDRVYPWFKAERFRPVAKTDISIFTALLHPTPEREQVTPP